MAAQRDWFEKDFYKRWAWLRAPPTRRSRRRIARLLAISTRTRTLATTVAEEKFKEVSAAYDVLGDEEKRKRVRRGPLAWARHDGRPTRRIGRILLQRR